MLQQVLVYLSIASKLCYGIVPYHTCLIYPSYGKHAHGVLFPSILCIVFLLHNYRMPWKERKEFNQQTLNRQ